MTPLPTSPRPTPGSVGKTRINCPSSPLFPENPLDKKHGSSSVHHFVATPGTAGERGAVAGVPATASDGALPAGAAGAAVGGRAGAGSVWWNGIRTGSPQGAVRGECRTLPWRHCRGPGSFSPGLDACRVSGTPWRSSKSARCFPVIRFPNQCGRPIRHHQDRM